MFPEPLLQVCFLLWTYVVAAIPFGLVVTTLFADDRDLRDHGSGNIGATNVARVFGWRFAAPVLALDIGKGAAPVWVAGQFWPDGGTAWLALVALTAFGAHCWSVYLEFQGGKGVATGAGALLVLSPSSAAAAIGAWVVTLALTGKSSVSSLVAAITLVVAAALFDQGALPAVLVLALGVALTHAANIRRLVRGEERQVVRPVRWNRAPTPTPAELLTHGPTGRPTTDTGWAPEDAPEP